MTGQPFDYIHPGPVGHWLNRTYPERPLTLGRAIVQGIIVAVIAFCLAYLFVKALEKEEFVDQAKQGKRFEQIQGQRKLPTWGADGPAYSSGHEYYRERKERNR